VAQQAAPVDAPGDEFIDDMVLHVVGGAARLFELVVLFRHPMVSRC
jgi:hypothetical protein